MLVISEEKMSGKVLIISYYWPPAGGPGVQRWLKFVKYLPDYHIEPIVYVPENAQYPIQDSMLVKEVRSDIKILKQPIAEPYQLASFFSKKTTQSISSGMIPDKKSQSFLEKTMLYIRGNFFIPDARKNWVTPSVNYLASVIQSENIETIVTTGPPHSMHLIGLELQKRFASIKWLADFRDPWTTIGYHKSLKLTKKSAKKHKDLEKIVLNSANHIVVTSDTTRKEFQKLTTKPISVITNGYDTTSIVKKPLDTAFSIAHIGSLLADRNPRVLWKAMSELLKEQPLFRAHFQLKLIGRVSPVILETLNEFKLTPYVKNYGYVSHDEALIEQRASQVLLLLEIDAEETIGIIPGKLFEYMAAERPILAIGPEKADFSEIIKQTNTGVFCQYDEKDKIKDTIWTMFQNYLNNDLKVHAIGLQYYSRKKLTEKLAEILKHLK